MSLPPADRPPRRDPGAEPLPRVGAGLSDSSAEGGPRRVRRIGPPGPPPPAPAARIPPAPAPVAPSATTPTEVTPSATSPTEVASVAPADPDLAPTSTAVEVESELPTTERPAGGRAGRNLAAAIGVGVSLAALILLSLLVWRPAFLLVLTGAALIGVVELTRALGHGRFRPPVIPVLVGTPLVIGLAWTRGPTGLVAGFLLTVLAVLVWRLTGGPVGYLRDSAAGVLVTLYVPLLGGFAALLLVPDDGALRVTTFVATVVFSDIGGYAAGVAFGKHPMAPSISPKKSWEGMGGSVAACVLVATLLITLALDGPWWAGLVFGTAMAVSATIGDLGESLIKRDLGIKDMGDLLPGHGGIMDRLDSLLPSAAVAYLLLSVLVPV